MSAFETGSRVQHIKYGLALIQEISPAGVRVRFDVAPPDLGGEVEDTVAIEDLQAPSPYSPEGTTETVLHHLGLLFEPNDRICLTFIHRSKKTATGAAITENHCMPLARATTRTCVARMQVRNDEGWNVYVAMNPLLPAADRRKKELAGTPRNVFMEVDENGDQVLMAIREAVKAGEVPPPSVVLRSSPGKYQFVWRISEDFTMDKIEAVNEALVSRFGADPASTDRLRVFRVPAFRNLKYAERPVVEIIETNAADRRYGFADFKVSVSDTKQAIVKPAAAEEELSAIVAYFEGAAAEAKLSISPLKKWGANGYLWEITCPWVGEHTAQKDSGSVVILHKSGALDFVCQHGHCVDRTWPKDCRPKLEEIVGHSLRFGNTPPSGLVESSKEEVEAATPVSEYTGPTSDGAIISVSTGGLIESVKNNLDVVTSMMPSEIVLPPFDTKYIKGFYSDLVGLVTEGNTLPPQFVFGVSKTLVGLRCAGKTFFEGCAKEPRYYFFMIGDSGVGKGESWRRTANVLTVNNSRLDFDRYVKILDSADSGAGLKDAFFNKDNQGTGIPVALFIDEILDFTAKTRSDRNPEIMTTMLSLAEGTSVSRVKAGGERRCNNARLAAILCGQPKLIALAFAGQKGSELGLFDRTTPDIAYPQVVNKSLAPIDLSAALTVSLAYDALPYEGRIKQTEKAADTLAQYWDSLPSAMKMRKRRLDQLTVDMYMMAFGRRSTEIEVEDALGAIYLDKRQETVREQHLQVQVPNEVGEFSRKIKDLIRGQLIALKAGVPVEKVTLSERDFMVKTNAYRDNKEVDFRRAWISLVDTLLRVIDDDPAKRGRKTKRYLPK